MRASIVRLKTPTESFYLSGPSGFHSSFRAPENLFSFITLITKFFFLLPGVTLILIFDQGENSEVGCIRGEWACIGRGLSLSYCLYNGGEKKAISLSWKRGHGRLGDGSRGRRFVGL